MLGGMQGTVASFDPETGGGTVYRDDGTKVSFGGEAFALSGLRLLRPGQRVQLTLVGDGVVTGIRIPTIHDSLE